MMTYDVAILGIYVADTAYESSRMPAIGETLIGSGFALGPGGKGSNQAVASALAGSKTAFISKIGNDPFGQMALDIYKSSGVTPELEILDDEPTGAAFIFVNDQTGDNAIIVYPGAGNHIDTDFVESKRTVIEQAKVFVTQLEQPIATAEYALKIAKSAGVVTVFNPAPMTDFDDSIYALCDYIIPNETETEMLVGFPIMTSADAQRAGKILCDRGVKIAIITMGGNGVYVYGDGYDEHQPAIKTNAIDTTGAGDAFIGGFSTAIAQRKDTLTAVRFGNATASIAVSRKGTAPAMPKASEIEDLLSQQ